MSWIAYWNGEFVPDESVCVSPLDRGFALGDAAYEVARTYRYVPFRLDWHLDRLWQSLEYLDIDPGLKRGEMEDLTREVLARNVHRLRPNDDVLLTQRITRGPNGPALGGPPSGPPTVIVTCRAIAFARFSHLYGAGVELRIPHLRLPSAGGIDPSIKTHSRLALALGALEVGRRGNDVLPLFANVAGDVTESSSSNVFFVFDGELVTPPDQTVLQGITRRVVLDLATQMGLRVSRRHVHLQEITSAEEAFVTATSFGLLPVRQIEDRPLAPIPGRTTRNLTAAFSRCVAVDIVDQSRSHAT